MSIIDYESYHKSSYNGQWRQPQPAQTSADIVNEFPDSRPHEGEAGSRWTSNSEPEMTVLPILIVYINLILIAGDV